MGGLMLSTTLNAQLRVAELTFKDGTLKAGRGKLKGNSVKFKAHAKAKAVMYHFPTLERVRIKDKNGIKTYVYLNIKGMENAMVLQEIAVGKVDLYHLVSHEYAPGFNNGGGPNSGVGFVGSQSYTINNFYLRKTDETEATHLGSNQLFTKNFGKAASKFFKDCPVLVQKIENKKYKKRDLKETVEFYNTKCN